MPDDDKDVQFIEESSIDKTVITWSAGLFIFYLVMLTVLGRLKYVPTLKTFLKYYKFTVPIICVLAVVIRNRIMLKAIGVTFSAQGLYLMFIFAFSMPSLLSCGTSVAPILLALLVVNTILGYYAIKKHDSIVDDEEDNWTRF